ncbi:hypothetical protein Hanom_Chr03g00258701 [Helianthus anomalus]
MNNKTLLLVIVFSPFALCIHGNDDDNKPNTKMDLVSSNPYFVPANLYFHEVSQRAFTNNPDRERSNIGTCIPSICPAGICYCCIQKKFCAPTYELCMIVCAIGVP